MPSAQTSEAILAGQKLASQQRKRRGSRQADRESLCNEAAGAKGYDCSAKSEVSQVGPHKRLLGRITSANILGYFVVFGVTTLYIRWMLPLPLFSLGEQIAAKRKALGLTQPALAKKARVGLSTLDALENGRLGELGYSKITNILSALGLELKLQEASTRRPTLDELMAEESDDEGLDRRR